MKQRLQLITIVGPTAVGKTELTLQLAKQLASSVISGDAYQVYREFSIGTAKPTMEERKGIPHYLIDILPPDGQYSVAAFQDAAHRYIQIENEQGRIPLLSGGTGLYVQALLEGYQFSEVGPDTDLRRDLTALYEKEGIDGLREYATLLGQKAKVPITFTDKHRLFRAIELLKSGQGDVLQNQNKQGLCYDGPVIGLQRDRQRLYERIDVRVDLMIEQGLVEEAKRLFDKGITEDFQAMKGIGYKELLPVFRGEDTLDHAVALIKKNTRNFAKRQITWYKRMPYIEWIPIEDDTTSEEILASACTILKKYNISL